MSQSEVSLTGARFIQTRFGLPQPWSPEEVQAHLAQARKELGSGWHTYLKLQRVWVSFPLFTIRGWRSMCVV